MNNKLTTLEAFNAMRLFLEKFYEETVSDDIGSLLGELEFLEDGGTADPAAWYSWEKCVNKISTITSNTLTSMEAFAAMRLFLEKYYDETLSEDALAILRNMQLSEQGTIVDSSVSKDWIICVKNAIEEKDKKKVMVLTK